MFFISLNSNVDVATSSQKPLNYRDSFECYCLGFRFLNSKCQCWLLRNVSWLFQRIPKTRARSVFFRFSGLSLPIPLRWTHRCVLLRWVPLMIRRSSLIVIDVFFCFFSITHRRLAPASDGRKFAGAGEGAPLFRCTSRRNGLRAAFARGRSRTSLLLWQSMKVERRLAGKYDIYNRFLFVFRQNPPLTGRMSKVRLPCAVASEASAAARSGRNSSQSWKH